VLNKGRDAAGKLLIELQVRKSTADGAGAREFYTKLTKPIPRWEGEIRNIVLQKKLVGLVTNIFFLWLTKLAFDSHVKYLCSPTHSLSTIRLF